MVVVVVGGGMLGSVWVEVWVKVWVEMVVERVEFVEERA